MSTVPEVLTAITAIGTATLPSVVQVLNGDITSVTTTRGRLFLVGDEEFDIQREFTSLGGVATSEHYVVPCSVVADLQTPDQSVSDAQAWADYEALEAAIAANPSLGLSGSFSLNAAIVGTQAFRRLASAEGRQSLVRFGVEVFAASN